MSQKTAGEEEMKPDQLESLAHPTDQKGTIDPAAGRKGAQNHLVGDQKVLHHTQRK